MNRQLRSFSILALALSLSAVTTAQQKGKQDKPDNSPRAAAKHYNLDKKRLAIKGYDPVAYFPSGGGKPKKGSAKITTTHRGVTYRFATDKNKKLFVANPAKFEPAYGGWCAYAMRDGNKVEVDPTAFLVQNDRLLLFYTSFFTNTKKSWSKGNVTAQEKKADGNWKKISGEGAPTKKTAKKKQPPKKAGK